MKIVKSRKFSWEHIILVSNIQEYGGSIINSADEDLLKSSNWPRNITRYNESLYRVIGLSEKLIGKDLQQKSWSSWTKELNIAKEFIKHFYFVELNLPKNNIPVIFKTKTNGFVLDIDNLHKDEEFAAMIDEYWNLSQEQKNNIGIMRDGIEYGSEQKEVFLPPLNLKWSDAFCLFDMKEKEWINL